MAPRAREEIVRPRRLADVVARPLNFTVRPPGQMRYLALQLITAYQRYVSPHKGFCCAYRTLTGRVSCSGYAAKAICRSGVLLGVRLTLRRIRRCSIAYAAISARPQGSGHLADGLRLQRGHCDLPVGDCHAPDGWEVADCAGNCASGPCDFWTPGRKKRDKAVSLSNDLEQ